MKLAELIELAKRVNELKDDVNTIAARNGGPEVLLNNETFFELFQTYEEDRLVSANGSRLQTKVCGVTFECIVYDHESRPDKDD